MIRTPSAILFMAFAIVLILPCGLILWSAMTENAGLMYSLSMTSVRIMGRIVGIRVHVEGIENIPRGVCHLSASNHVSKCRIQSRPFPAVPCRLSVIAKKELFRIPILSFGMQQAGFVPLDRSDRKAAAEAWMPAVRELKKRTCRSPFFRKARRSLDGQPGTHSRKGHF